MNKIGSTLSLYTINKFEPLPIICKTKVRSYPSIRNKNKSQSSGSVQRFSKYEKK